MKKILLFISIAIMIFTSSCSNESFLQEVNPETDKEGRTIALTAFMPGDNPTTRVGLEQQEDKSINLTWEITDELQLVFVQGASKTKSTATVTSISDNGKSAQFNIVLPTTGFDESVNFNLYGVYGGGGLSTDNPTHVVLPSNVDNATSLEDLKNNKDVMLYFASEDINLTTNPKISVSFQHLGSLFSITLKNNSSTSLSLEEARLVGVGGDGKWAYNAGTGGEIYDLENEKLLNAESAGDFISFKSGTNNLLAGNTTTFWGWYPPLPDKNWPELKLELRDTNLDLIATSENKKPAKFSATDAGMAYYFYAAWDGAKLEFGSELILEVELDKSNFGSIFLPKDAGERWPSSYLMSAMWDNITGETISKYQSNPKNLKGGTPVTFTVDLEANGAQNLKLTKIKINQVSNFMANTYREYSPKTFKIYGSNNPSTDNDWGWDSWTEIADCHSVKPSGLPEGERSDEDFEYAKTGETFYFYEPYKYYRYIRFKITDVWMHSTFDWQYILIEEITLWGVE